MRIDGISATGVSSQLGVAAASGPLAAGKTAAAGFEQALSQTFNGAFASLQAGEAAAIQGLQGSSPQAKVVEAVMGAQRTLQSALAIRDKAVSAFQENTDGDLKRQLAWE